MQLEREEQEPGCVGLSCEGEEEREEREEGMPDKKVKLRLASGGKSNPRKGRLVGSRYLAWVCGGWGSRRSGGYRACRWKAGK